MSQNVGLDGLTLAPGQPPRSLRDALRAAAEARGSAGSEASLSATPSDSPSEEDYDDIAAPPAEAMVMRKRHPHTQLRNEVQPGKGEAAAAAAADKYPELSEKPTAITTAFPPKTAAGVPLSMTSSRRQRDGRRLSATVIFEEKAGTQSLSSAATAVSTGSSIDGDVARSTIKEDPDEAKVSIDGRSYVVSIDDPKLAEILRVDLENMREEMDERRQQQAALAAAATDSAATATATKRRRRRHRGQFRDIVFTRKFSTFDRQNEAAANSPFHGFFTLFWIGVFLFIVKIGADNYRKTGSILGANEIMTIMFHRDVVVLLASDGALCALTGVSWLLQRAVRAGWLDWDGAGWVVQNLWQMLYTAGFIGWTQVRSWPWSHTVFFVLHGIVMLMKQHSYAFYNGYLSTLYKRRAALQARLQQLEDADAAAATGNTEPPTPATESMPMSSTTAVDADNNEGIDRIDMASAASLLAKSSPAKAAAATETLGQVVAALQSGQPLDRDQVRIFARVLRWEVDILADELRGKATQPARAYPHNLTMANHYEYIVLPTVVYELEYPRSDTISWRYAAEKLAAVFGIIFVMIMISQAFIYPVVMQTVAMKEAGLPLADRFRAFPWMLTDLIFPFMMEYLLTWYLIWETILNFLAEITFFADRSFYAAWWNSVTWDEFARDWNRPVHLFLLRHVYHSSISAMKVNRHAATLITFFLSACVHELVMACIFRKVRGYLLVLQMFQLPLVQLSRTKYMRNRETLGNVIFWLGIFIGPGALCSLYLIL